MKKSKTAFLFSAQRLAATGLYMWTFTLKETMDIKDVRKRWNYLLTLLRRKWPQFCGLRVYEMHETHGLHVHLVTNRYVRVEDVRRLAIKSGWGRIHVQRIQADRAAYLAKYLGKDREPCLKGWRLWAGFGDWDWSRVKDIVLESPRSKIYAVCKAIYGWTGSDGRGDRMILVEKLYPQSLRDATWGDPPGVAA